MTKNSVFKRQTDALRRKRNNKYGSKRTPVQLSQLLGKPEIPPGTYRIDEKTNVLFPKSLPKNGDLVMIESGPCPRDMETNIIIEKDLSGIDYVFSAWIPSYKFYILQVVIFWKNGYQYEYQIQFSDSDDQRVGRFVLLEQRRTEKQPGVAYRVPGRNDKK